MPTTARVPGPGAAQPWPAPSPGPPPPFDPELADALEAAGELLRSPLTPDQIPVLRELTAAMPAPSDEDLRCGGAFDVTELLVPGPAGAPEVSLLVCRPAGVTAPLPAVYHMHGGGMITGDNRMGVLRLLDWARELQFTVLSVAYRLAPECPFPAPVEDCYAGLMWAAGHAAELGVGPDRIVVVGHSAGGGLAAALALMARDRGGPRLAGQLLMSPMLDDRNDTVSSWQLAGIGGWDRTANETAWAALLGDARGGPDVSPYAAPARVADLSGLPPAFIDAGSAETFRDEDVTYASRIWQAGGIAELHVWPGGCHGFEMMAPEAAVSRAASAAQRNWLRRLLAG